MSPYSQKSLQHVSHAWYVCPPSTNNSLNIFEAFGALWSRWRQRFQLVAFFVLGLIFATLHHLLGNYLSGRPVSSVVSSGLSFPSQSRVGMLSNALSELVRWLLISTIDVAYAQ